MAAAGRTGRGASGTFRFPAVARRAWRLLAFLVTPMVLCVVAAAGAGPAQSPPGTTQQTAVQPPSGPPAPGTPAPPPTAPSQAGGAQAAPPTVPAGAQVPADYVIGPDDILSIIFWRDKDMSADVVVRPDGRITLPLVNDVQAGGLAPEGLRDRIRTEAAKYIEDPNVTVVVKQINSRRVFITGNVSKPGAYALSNPTTVLQLLSMAGGVNEFADDRKIVVMRAEDGTQKALRFNYRDVSQGKRLQQNILLKPGDTVVVP